MFAYKNKETSRGRCRSSALMNGIMKMTQRPRAAASDQGNGYGVCDLAYDLQVVSLHHSITVNGVQKDLPSAQVGGAFGNRDRVHTCPLPAAIDKNFAAPQHFAAKVNGNYNALAAEFPGGGPDQVGISHSFAIERNFFKTCFEKPAHVCHGPNASAISHRHEAFPGKIIEQSEVRRFAGRGRVNVKDQEFVGFLFIKEPDGVETIAKIDGILESASLHKSPIAQEEAGDDAFAVHGHTVLLARVSGGRPYGESFEECQSEAVAFFRVELGAQNIAATNRAGELKTILRTSQYVPGIVALHMK